MGANDGMLHAINAITGAEMFAYVPSPVIADLPKLTDLAYTHRYFVDGSPTVGDVFYNSAWHTLLVAGMRAGAKGLFALDVTDPSQFNEANAASIVRWEFQDPDLGYVFGQPLLVKTNNGRWSVVVSGGYNVGNASGHAFLFVIDAETGALVAKIDTGAGTAASPERPLGSGGDRHQRRRRRRLSPTPATSTASSGSSISSARRRAAGRSATAACRCSPPAPATRSPAAPTSPSSPPAASWSPSAPAATSRPPTTPT